MTHLAFEYRPDHDFIAAQVEADLTTTPGVVIAGPWSAHPSTDTPDNR